MSQALTKTDITAQPGPEDSNEVVIARIMHAAHILKTNADELVGLPSRVGEGNHNQCVVLKLAAAKLKSAIAAIKQFAR